LQAAPAPVVMPDAPDYRDRIGSMLPVNLKS